MKLRLVRLLVTGFCLATLALPEVVWACPTCKDGLHDDGTAAAYAVSILFMMSMPFLIFTCWVVTIYRLRANVAADATSNIAVSLTNTRRVSPES